MMKVQRLQEHGEQVRQHDHRQQPLVAVDPGAGEREAFHTEDRAVNARRQGLEILQAIELAGLEAACGQRGLHHHFNDVRREADHVFDDGAQLGVELGEKARLEIQSG